MTSPVLNSSQIKIQPSDIDASRRFMKTFGYRESEEAAERIVRHCQEQGFWAPLSRQDLNEMFSDQPHFWMMLARDGWINQGEDGHYRVTEGFVEKCHRASPAGSPISNT